MNKPIFKCELCGKKAKYKITATINNSVSYACPSCLKQKREEFSANLIELSASIGSKIHSLTGLDLTDTIKKMSEQQLSMQMKVEGL